MKFIRHVPNMLTLLRLIGAVCLIFLKPLTGLYYIVYTVCGLTDALDGFIARKFDCCTPLGSKLDSVADLSFYIVMLVKLIPVLWLRLPRWFWLWIGAILVIRICAYLVAAWKYHRFASLHTYWNKATGLLVFLVPYMLATDVFVWFAGAVCTVATIGSGRELATHCRSKEYKAA